MDHNMDRMIARQRDGSEQLDAGMGQQIVWGSPPEAPCNESSPRRKRVQGEVIWLGWESSQLS